MQTVKPLWMRASSHYQKIFRQGYRLRGTSFNLVFLSQPELAQVSWGIAVGRKFGPAVARNRVKRIARQAIRKYFRRFSGRYGVILEVLPEAAKLPSKKIWSAIESLLEKGIEKLK